MINRRNFPRYAQSPRDMNDCTTKMGLNEFVGLEKNSSNNIDDMEKISNMPLAMAYVPWQQWRMIYEPKEALKRGTIFKELDLPFEAAKECK